MPSTLSAGTARVLSLKRGQSLSVGITSEVPTNLLTSTHSLRIFPTASLTAVGTYYTARDVSLRPRGPKHVRSTDALILCDTLFLRP